MPYLDSKIIGFINFFYDEVQKQKLPWIVKIVLFDPATRDSLMDGLRVDIIRKDMDLNYTKYFTKEQITLPKSSPDHLAKYAVEDIRKEFDRWSLENL